MQIALIIAAVGVFVFLAHLFAVVFTRTGLPDVLFLILIGLLLGPILHVVTPVHLGMVGPVFTSITLAIILFESGSGLRPGTLGSSFGRGLWLTFLNFVVSVAVVSIAVRYLTSFGWARSLLLGAVVGGTSSAIVIPMVGSLNLESIPRTMLILESAASDVLCIVTALALLKSYELGSLRPAAVGLNIILSFLASAVIGLAAGFIWAILLRRMRMMRNALLLTPAFVCVVFGVVELLGFSGAIAALALGVMVGNSEFLRLPWLRRLTRNVPLALDDTERTFFAEIVFLLKTFFFIYLGVSIQLAHLPWIWLGLALALAMFVVRIPVIRLSASRSIGAHDASLMAVIVPKGLAAAVLASIPLSRGVEGGDLIQNVTYAVVLFSIVMTSVLVFLVNRTGLSKIYAALLGRPGDRPPD